MNHREFVLSYERNRWRATAPGLEIVHTELRGLEALIEARLADERAPLAVELKFDDAALPRWLRQYHGHYCNYTLFVGPRKGHS
jgi:hypothetical protein